MVIASRCQAWQTRQLRRAVLRPDADPAAPLPGDDVERAVHLGVFDGVKVLGACVVLPQPCPLRPGEPAWRLRGMATAPEHRNQGVGTLLLAASYEVAEQDGCELIWCLARETAIGFYERDGWAVIGAPVQAVGIAHSRMWRSVRPRGRIAGSESVR